MLAGIPAVCLRDVKQMRNSPVYGDDSFINTRPLMISTAAATRIKLTCSPKKMIPAKKAPTAPMPVQTVYAVPSGSDRIEYDRRAKLMIMVTRVTSDGANRVKPSDNFME